MKIFIFLLLISCFAIVILPACNPKGTPEDSVNILITKDGLKNISIALELYNKEFGQYPETLDELLLKKGISDKSIIKDAWGKPYYYKKIGDGYQLFSMGKDGKPFTKWDIKLPSILRP